MAVSSAFYTARAAESAQNAKNATLDNVRERCLRSQTAWLSMANGVTLEQGKHAKLASEKITRGKLLNQHRR